MDILNESEANFQRLQDTLTSVLIKMNEPASQSKEQLVAAVAVWSPIAEEALVAVMRILNDEAESSGLEHCERFSLEDIELITRAMVAAPFRARRMGLSRRQASTTAVHVAGMFEDKFKPGEPKRFVQDDKAYTYTREGDEIVVRRVK